MDEKEKLKNSLKELEEKEFEYISKIKNTVIMKQQELEEFKSNKLNNSLVMTSNKKTIKIDNEKKRPVASSIVKERRVLSAAKKVVKKK
jgi:transcriptional regulator NrdR family protein